MERGANDPRNSMMCSKGKGKGQRLEKDGQGRGWKDMRPVKWQWEDHRRPCRT